MSKRRLVGPRWAPYWPHEICYLGCLGWNRNISFSCSIVLKFCTEHDSNTAVLCVKFQNNWNSVQWNRNAVMMVKFSSQVTKISTWQQVRFGVPHFVLPVDIHDAGFMHVKHMLAFAYIVHGRYLIHQVEKRIHGVERSSAIWICSCPWNPRCVIMPTLTSLMTAQMDKLPAVLPLTYSWHRNNSLVSVYAMSNPKKYVDVRALLCFVLFGTVILPTLIKVTSPTLAQSYQRINHEGYG